MEMKKVLRKATALAASASFIGATMLGAVAQDLAKYPAPFVSNGVFDAFIVVGANAQPADVVGSVDIGASLQFALKKTTTASAGASEATIDSGVKIEKTGNNYNYDDTLGEVEEFLALTSDDIPTVLADGKYVESQGTNKNSETYTQALLFNDRSNTTTKLLVEQDDDLAPKADDYLFIDKNTQLYNYTLEFDTAIDYENSTSTLANDDLKTTTLTLQGQTYTITEATVDGGNLHKLTLLSGEAVLWLTQNNPVKKTVSGVEHTIEVIDVTEDADACQLKVDDVTSIVDIDETKTVNGVQLGITDARAIHAQLQDTDVCQVSIGATEVQLHDGEKVKVDDKDLDGSKTYIGTDGAEWETLRVTYKPTDQDDDLYLAKGKEFIDPIFKSWKVVYGGLTADYETYTFKSGADNGEFKFNNNDGKEVEIPIYLNESATTNKVEFGDGGEKDEMLYGKGAAGGANSSLRTACKTHTADVSECEGMLILAGTANGEAHVFKVASVDFSASSEENTTDIEDVTYGKTYNDLAFTAGVETPLPLGSFGTLPLNITYGNISVGITIKSKLETHTQGSVQLFPARAATSGASNATVRLFETDRTGSLDITEEMRPGNVTMTATGDVTDDDIDLVPTLQTEAGEFSYSEELEDDSDYTMLVTEAGTRATYNDEDDNSIVVLMPKEEVYGNVFVAPTLAVVSTAGGGVPTYTLTKLNVGAAKLDSEITDVGANNLIVVGGPCANKISAQVLGKTFPACGADSGIAANTAIIKEVVQSSGKVALVVAGYEADDTRRATRVLSNYDTYQTSGDLTGSGVTVTGTSMTDIKVTKSA